MPGVRVALAIIGILAAPVCLADAGIYAFVDARGEVHLSNVPDDVRFEVVIEAPPAPPVIDNTIKALPAAAPMATESARPYTTEVARAAGRYGLDAALLHAVISVESGYNPRAVSRRGAAGLMQLMPGTAKRYGVINVFDPAENVRAGAQYLSDLLKLFNNDLRLALAAYNAGEAAVLKYGNIPPYRETVGYVPKVVGFYQRLRLLM